ncbi:hypothetical protein [Streptomyces achromogenes]|uniref:hypothetical protein n=1 Tax=Streptomyces achromogenes TaxID=67255 RepID=UPI00367F465D
MTPIPTICGRSNRPKPSRTRSLTRNCPVELFSAIVALTVEIVEDPWLPDSTARDSAGDWRRLPIPHGRGLFEYVIDTNHHHVVRLTRLTSSRH